MTSLADAPAFGLAVKPDRRVPPFDTSRASHVDEELMMAAGNAAAAVARKVTLRGVLITVAALLLAALATAEGIVSWRGQFSFILAIKHEQLPAALEALGPDCGAVIFALLGVALALLGRRAITERLLVCACSGLSIVMNLGAANLGSPRAIGAYVMPPVLFAITSDRLIATIRIATIGRDEGRSAWLALARIPLWIFRLAVSPVTTVKGARAAVLLATPLPQLAATNVPAQVLAASPPALAASPVSKSRVKRRGGKAVGTTKTSRLLAMAAERHDLPALPLGEVSSIATGLAAEVDLHPGTARRVLLSHVRGLQSGGE